MRVCVHDLCEGLFDAAAAADVVVIFFFERGVDSKSDAALEWDLCARLGVRVRREPHLHRIFAPYHGPQRLCQS